jgi:hypothetical protein
MFTLHPLEDFCFKSLAALATLREYFISFSEFAPPIGCRLIAIAFTR